jgi:hypothetical protein
MNKSRVNPHHHSQELERLADLTPKQYEALVKIRKGNSFDMHPSTRLQLVKDGLAERVEAVGLFGPQLAAAEHMLKLTDHGKDVLERADACLAGTWQYKPILSRKDLELLDKASKVAVANRCKKHLGLEVDSMGVKLMVSLAKSPESYRWLCQIYGHWTLPKISGLDLIEGERKRGSLWSLTRKGALALAEVAGILRKERKS